MNQIYHLLFDLDGTLTDPAEGITKCINHALVALGAPARPAQALYFCIGPPLHESFAKLLGTDAPEVIARALALYRERFLPVGMFENRLYHGVPQTLAQLRRAGHRLYLATSKPQPYARKIIQHFRLAKYFHKIYGSRLDGTRSDKRELLHHIVQRELLAPAAAVMIGDRGTDMAAARAHGLQALGVTYGYGSADELWQGGAQIICDSPGDLPLAIRHLNNPDRFIA